MILGVSGNMCFLIMMVRFRQMRSTVNYYLTSLCHRWSYDIDHPEELRSWYLITQQEHICYFPTDWTDSIASLCTLSQMLFFFISLFHITMVTLEIFYTLCKPLVHIRISSTRRTFGLIFLSWFAGIIFGFATNLPLWMEIIYFCVIWSEKIALYSEKSNDCRLLLFLPILSIALSGSLYTVLDFLSPWLWIVLCTFWFFTHWRKRQNQQNKTDEQGALESRLQNDHY